MSAPIRLMYGGTFDPFHDGHLSIAIAARDTLAADVFVTPAADPPHRATTGASATQRAEMVSLAIANIDALELDTRELERQGPSYTVDTLREIREECGADRSLAILVGMDSFLSIPKWNRWREIQRLAHVIVAERPGQELNSSALEGREARSVDALQQTTAGLIYRLRQPTHPASATAIRVAVTSDAPDWDEWLNPQVAAYIARNHLYSPAVSI